MSHYSCKSCWQYYDKCECGKNKNYKVKSFHEEMADLKAAIRKKEEEEKAAIWGWTVKSIKNASRKHRRK